MRRKLLKPDDQCFYVYLHVTYTGRVFYVGKGANQRARSLSGRSKAWRSVATMGYSIVIAADGLIESAAYALEAELIAHFRKFGPITNVFDHGKQSPSSLPHIANKISRSASAWQTGRVLPESTKQRIRESLAGRRRPEHSALLRSRKFWSKEQNPFYGKGDAQRGAANVSAKSVVARREGVERTFATLTMLADELGVTVQAVSQALRRGGKTCGWEVGVAQ